jgi:hypothetical protein
MAMEAIGIKSYNERPISPIESSAKYEELSLGESPAIFEIKLDTVERALSGEFKHSVAIDCATTR